jgi:hypothetical protein
VNEAFRVNAVFGIELPASLQDMTELIGLRTGHAVRFYKTTNPNAYEECGIENHVPSIGLRDPDGIDLYNIAHGLFHLRCRIRWFSDDYHEIFRKRSIPRFERLLRFAVSH